MNSLWILTFRYLGGVLIEGGSDTTSFFIQSLFLALVSFPEVARKAQEEIDHVVGTHRLPTMKDFKHLPYIRAIIQEALFCPVPFMLRTDAIMFS
jgi:cytochrome P450